MEHIKNILVGIVLGVCNIIPGVSAGTMAVVLNIYDRLLDAVSFNKEKIKEHFTFLVTLGVGAVIGILVFSNGITYLFENYPMQTQFTFIGIILGSIPMVIGNAKKDGPIRIGNYVPAVISFGVMLFMIVMDQQGSGAETVLDQSIWSAIGLLLSGAFAAFAMIIPGISGSFIMVTLGTYHTVINAISVTGFNIGVIAVTGVGVLIGLLLGIKIVKVLLSRYNQATYMAILGLVLGSILVIYPGFSFDGTGIASLIMLLVGAFVAYKFAD